MAKDMSKILLKIEDEAGWHSLIDSSEDKLVICDIHQDWCGPTEAIHPTMLRVFQVRAIKFIDIKISLIDLL
jgi:hypothetical protein